MSSLFHRQRLLELDADLLSGMPISDRKERGDSALMVE
jgi:hypothetical protein